MPRRRRGSLTFFEPRRAHARVSVSAEAPAVAVTAGASRYALDLSAAFLRALLRGLSTTSAAAAAAAAAAALPAGGSTDRLAVA